MRAHKRCTQVLAQSLRGALKQELLQRISQITGHGSYMYLDNNLSIIHCHTGKV